MQVPFAVTPVTAEKNAGKIAAENLAPETFVRILLLEDEPHIARPVTQALAAQGHTVTHAATLMGARAAFLEAEPDLLLLDVRLPEDDNGGFAFARETRASGYAGLILFMTARDALADRVTGLDDGGDDYVVKPFDLPELLARVRALLRRLHEAKTSRVQRGRLELDTVNRSVTWAGERVELSSREYALLERFVLSPSRVYSPEALTDALWGEGAGTGVVKVYVHHLRSKLGPEVVQTVPGGYRLGL